jgi:Predicted transcriptional regulators
MSSPEFTDAAAIAMQPEVSPEFTRECVEFFAELVHVLGLGRSVGQIYGLLFASPRALSFTDIADALDISRGSTSQGLNFLRELGAVRVVTGENERQFFEPELQLRKLVAGVLRERVDPVVKGGAVRIRQLREHAKVSPTPAGEKFAQERLKKLENWRRQMGLLLPILKTILGPGRA